MSNCNFAGEEHTSKVSPSTLSYNSRASIPGSFDIRIWNVMQAQTFHDRYVFIVNFAVKQTLT
jgi:hypothetical protein